MAETNLKIVIKWLTQKNLLATSPWRSNFMISS